jgi:hypothetical protein
MKKRKMISKEKERKKRILLEQFNGYIRGAQSNSQALEGCLKKIISIWKEICELEEEDEI